MPTNECISNNNNPMKRCRLLKTDTENHTVTIILANDNYLQVLFWYLFSVVTLVIMVVIIIQVFFTAVLPIETDCFIKSLWKPSTVMISVSDRSHWLFKFWFLKNMPLSSVYDYWMPSLLQTYSETKSINTTCEFEHSDLKGTSDSWTKVGIKWILFDIHL